MNENIKVVSENIVSQLTQFQDEMMKMEALFTELENQTAKVNSFWEGKGSMSAVSAIKKFMETFIDVKNQNEKYVSFLNSTISKYTTADTNISSSIEAAANNGLGINNN